MKKLIPALLLFLIACNDPAPSNREDPAKRLIDSVEPGKVFQQNIYERGPDTVYYKVAIDYCDGITKGQSIVVKMGPDANKEPDNADIDNTGAVPSFIDILNVCSVKTIEKSKIKGELHISSQFK